MKPDDAIPNEAALTQQLLQLTIGYMPAMCLNIVAKLGVADLLTRGPENVQEIARATQTNEDALYRVLRALSTTGVFQELEGRKFAQTPASDLLRADHPHSLRAAVVFLPDPMHFHSYANLMHSVKTGEPTAVPTFGKPLFEYLQNDPEESEVFNAAMVNGTQVMIPAVLAAYDFTGIRTLVDVGGGHGSVLASVLQKYPDMKGILFDLDHVAAGADTLFKKMGVADRAGTIAGDFFKSVPAGGDAYIMKNIIHDWDDDKCAIILRNIRQALNSQKDGRLLILDNVVPAEPVPHPSKWFDIEMLALPGGRERTEDEFRALLDNSGWRLTRIVPTPSFAAVIEGALKS